MGPNPPDDLAEHRRLEPHGAFQCPVKNLFFIHAPDLEYILTDHGGKNVLGGTLDHIAQADVQDQRHIADPTIDSLGQCFLIVIIIERPEDQMLFDGLIIRKFVDQRKTLHRTGLQILDVAFYDRQDLLHAAFAVNPVKLRPYGN